MEPKPGYDDVSPLIHDPNLLVAAWQQTPKPGSILTQDKVTTKDAKRYLRHDKLLDLGLSLAAIGILAVGTKVVGLW